MKCLTPYYVRRVFFDVLTKQKTQSYDCVPCGKCFACKSNKRNEWSWRLQQEHANSVFSLFITLTYDDIHVPQIYDSHNDLRFVVRKRDVQLFFKRYRVALSNYNIHCRYFLCSEYGPRTLRPHYHGLLFFDKFDPVLLEEKVIVHNNQNCITNKLLYDSWRMGFIHSGTVTAASIHYTTKYCLKNFIEDNIDDVAPDFVLMSRKPALGSNYIDKMKGIKNLTNVCYFENGQRGTLPRIIRNKLNIPVDDNYIKDCRDAIEQEYREYCLKYGDRSFFDFIRIRNESIKQQQINLINKHKNKIL